MHPTVQLPSEHQSLSLVGLLAEHLYVMLLALLLVLNMLEEGW